MSNVIPELSIAPSWTDIIDITDVIIITGRRRHGKSALLYFLLDTLGKSYNMPKKAWGIPYHKQQYFDSTIEHFNEIELIEGMYYNCIGLDEIHQIYDARNTMKALNKLISLLMTFTGQRNQILLLATLNNALIDINTFRITNPILAYKRVGILQAQTERSELRKFTLKASKEWQRVPHGKKNSPERALEASLTYIFCDEYEGWIQNPKPAWWTENTSEIHAIRPEDQKEILDIDLNKYTSQWHIFLKNKLAFYPKKERYSRFKELKNIYTLDWFYLNKILEKERKN